MAKLDTDETSALISASKVEGTPVFNTAGDKLGTVEEVMINKRSGRVAYSVMSFGGFLGMGEKFHPLPWDMLTYDTDKDGYVVNLSKDQLKSAPSFGPEEGNRLREREYEQRVHDYYEVPPYWL